MANRQTAPIIARARGCDRMHACDRLESIARAAHQLLNARLKWIDGVHVDAQHPTGFFGLEEMRCRQTCRTILDYTYKARYVHVFFFRRGREGDERKGRTGRAEGQGGRDRDGREEGCAIPTFCPARSRFVHQDHTTHSCLFPPLLLKRGLHSQMCVELLDTLAVWLATTGRLARCSDTQLRRQTEFCSRSRR